MKLDRTKLNKHEGTGAPNAFFRVLGRLRSALVYAIQHETERESQDQDETEFVDRQLPEPPHLEPGELKYGNGMHDYF